MKVQTQISTDPKSKKVTVKFEKEGRVYTYDIYRSNDSEVEHRICCTSFEQSDCERAITWTKTYTDSAKFDAAIKSIL